MHTEIKQWGNSAAVRLSSKTLALASLEVHSQISIKVKGKKIIIEPVLEEPRAGIVLPFSEGMLLTGLTPETAHADEIAVASMVELEGN